MGKLVRICALVVVAGVCMGPAAHAFIYAGDEVGGSWAIQGWEDGSGGYYDFVRIDWLSGPSYFESPAFRDYSSPTLSGQSWAVAWECYDGGNLIRTAMDGPRRNSNLYFAMWFTGNPNPTPISFNYALYDRTNTTDPWRLAQRWTWNNGWSFVNLTETQWDPGVEDPCEPIPEPASLLLLGAGLAIAGRGIRRKNG